MIGCSNLKIDPLLPDFSSGFDPNNNFHLSFIDVDDDESTINSSSAMLKLSGDGVNIDNCGNVVYAGLYWTGRAHNQFLGVDYTPTPETLYKEHVIYPNKVVPEVS